jgi:hypothetical protein
VDDAGRWLVIYFPPGGPDREGQIGILIVGRPVAGVETTDGEK